MNLDKNNSDDQDLPERDSLLMESLLTQALQGESPLDEQLEKLSTRIRNESVNADRKSVQRKTSPTRRHWFSISAAASILILLSLVAMLPTRSTALATVERSLQAEVLPIDRQYEVALVARAFDGGDYRFTVDLYIRQDRTAVHTRPDHVFGELWIFKDGDESWIVPVNGASPFLVEGSDLVPNRPPVGSAPLVISTALESLRQGHDLQQLPDATLPGLLQGEESNLVCDHILGTRRPAAPRSVPERVEFWADQDRGIVRKLSVQFNDALLMPIRSLEAQLVSTADLDADFFDVASRVPNASAMN
ncbi:MAG: hypothetical protein AAGG44_19610 [Planctomycetota bacterium]